MREDEIVEEAVEEDENSEYIAELRRMRDEGEITEEEYREATAEYLMDDEYTAYDSESKKDVAITSDIVDAIRNSGISVVNNTGKALRSNATVNKVGVAKVRAYRAIGNVLGFDIKLFDGDSVLGKGSGVDGDDAGSTLTDGIVVHQFLFLEVCFVISVIIKAAQALAKAGGVHADAGDGGIQGCAHAACGGKEAVQCAGSAICL